MPHQQYNNPHGQDMMSAKEQTLMWQQNSYLCDSGFQSGATTQVPSISGHEEEDGMENDPLMFDMDQGYAQNFTHEEVDDMNAQLGQTRSQCRAAMFPESHEDGINIPSAQFDQHQLTPEQRLAEVTEMLKHDVASLINYQDDAHLIEHALPKLAKFLNDENNCVASRAAQLVHQLSSQKEAG